ncbi:MAG: protein kinase [Polyangiaceae bacterium]
MTTPNGTRLDDGPRRQAPRAATSFVPAAGEVIAARYRLEKLLGRGGMGQVWLAKHTELDTPFAVKFLEKSLLDDVERDTTLQRFRDEAKITSALAKRTRHIVAVTDYGDIGGAPFLVMEVLEGRSLDEALRSRPFTPEGTLVILRQLAKALATAHGAGLIHRDLKPANVFVCKDDDGSPLVKVLDFGLVRPVRPQDRKSTQKGIAVGTPSYMSPEQARALPDVDHRADVWSLAVVSYEMMTGKEPWEGETAQEVLVNVCRSEYAPVSKHVPALRRFDAFYERAFRRHVDDRYRSAEELVEAFGRACAHDEGPDTGPVTAEEPAIPAGRSRRGPLVAGLLATLALGIVVPLALRTGPQVPASASPASGSAQGSAAAPSTPVSLAPVVAVHDLPAADPPASAALPLGRHPTATTKPAMGQAAPISAATPKTAEPATPKTAEPAAPKTAEPAAPKPPEQKPHDKSAVF